MRKARQKVQKKPFGMCEGTLTFVWQLKKKTHMPYGTSVMSRWLNF